MASREVNSPIKIKTLAQRRLLGGGSWRNVRLKGAFYRFHLFLYPSPQQSERVFLGDRWVVPVKLKWSLRRAVSAWEIVVEPLIQTFE